MSTNELEINECDNVPVNIEFDTAEESCDDDCEEHTTPVTTKTNLDTEGFVRVKHAAEMANLSVGTIYNWVKSNKVEHKILGKKQFYVNVESLNKIIKNLKTP